MSLTAYSTEEKVQALRIAETDGVRAAARAIGCSHTTVLRWWADAEVERSIEEKEERERQRQSRMSVVKARNRLRLAEVAAQHLDASAEAENSLDAQRWMTAAAIALDKLTTNTAAHRYHSHSDDDVQLSAQNRADLDREFRQLVREMERAVAWAFENGMPDPRTRT